MHLSNNRWCRRTGVALLAAVFVARSALPQHAKAHDSWWSENFEVHGFFTSKLFIRSPGLQVYEENEISSWRNELNLEMDFRFYDGNLFGESTRISGYAVMRPIYEAIYEVNPNLWGDNVDKGDTLSGQLASNSFKEDAYKGKRTVNPVPALAGLTGLLNTHDDGARTGGCLESEFCIVNNDLYQLFTGKRGPGVIISTELFGGAVIAPWLPRSDRQEAVGGPGTVGDWTRYVRLNANGNGIAFLVPGSQASIAAGLGVPDSGGFAGRYDVPAFQMMAAAGTLPAGTLGSDLQGAAGFGPSFVTGLLNQFGGDPDNIPLNWYQPGQTRVSGFGNINTLNKYFDVNRRESELKMDCFDAAHPHCFAREFYIDVEWGNWFFRLGKQQLSWGKTDAFRLQDKINPLDFGYRNVFPDLEERRIPQLALDVIYSAGDIGPLQDVSFEFAWLFDRFLPDQAGQCGEPYAFTGLCHLRTDLSAHGLLNWGTRGVDEVHWKLDNTEPWARIEFRIPKPALSMSLSAGWTFQDIPVARKIPGTEWSYQNPNPAGMLLASSFAQIPVIEDCLDGSCAAFLASQNPADLTAGVVSVPADLAVNPRLAALAGGPTVGGSIWTTGWDPIGIDPTTRAPIAGGSLEMANDLARIAYVNAFDELGCGSSSRYETIAQCAEPFRNIGLGWMLYEDILEFPRILTLGASLDYQIPRIDTILRLEVASDINRRIQSTSEYDYVEKSNVFQAAIGLDRSTFIPFLNRNRTAFLSFQTFVEHIVDYQDDGKNRGMVPYQTDVISTFFMQNYWRNDTIILTNFVAVLWKSGGIVSGPTLRWVVNDNLFFDTGVNMLFGRKREQNLWDVCGQGAFGTDPTRGQGRADGGLSCLRDPADWSPGQVTTLHENYEQSDESAFGHGRQQITDRLMRDRDEIWFGVTYQW